jgi:predicted ester cyclase
MPGAAHDLRASAGTAAAATTRGSIHEDALMAVDANRALVRRYLDIYNDAAWDRLAEVLAPDYAHHSNDDVLSPAQFIRGASWIRAGLPDFHVDAVDLVAEGDRVACRWMGTGTHRGSMFGEAPTGAPITLHGITEFRVADGLIAEDWEAMDEADLRRKVMAAAAET